MRETGINVMINTKTGNRLLQVSFIFQAWLAGVIALPLVSIHTKYSKLTCLPKPEPFTGL